MHSVNRTLYLQACWSQLVTLLSHLSRILTSPGILLSLWRGYPSWATMSSSTTHPAMGQTILSLRTLLNILILTTSMSLLYLAIWLDLEIPQVLSIMICVSQLTISLV